MMSVVVEGPGGERQLRPKGAPEAVLLNALTSRVRARFSDGADPGRKISSNKVNDLSEDGFRALAVATRKWTGAPPIQGR